MGPIPAQNSAQIAGGHGCPTVAKTPRCGGIWGLEVSGQAEKCPDLRGRAQGGAQMIRVWEEVTDRAWVEGWEIPSQLGYRWMSEGKGDLTPCLQRAHLDTKTYFPRTFVSPDPHAPHIG